MQRDSAADQELVLKKRARRRLVGALALVLLMVTLLPLVLKDRSQEKVKEQVKITLPGDISSPVPVSSETQDVPSDFDSKVIPGETVQDQPDPEASGHDSEAAPGQATTVLSSEQTVRSTHEATQKTEASNSNTGKKFYIQVGVFSELANVKRLQAKLSELGYSSATEKINTPNGQKIRLRTQVFTGRDEAATALEKIKDAGLTGMVVSQ